MYFKAIFVAAAATVATATTYPLPSNDSFYNPGISTYEDIKPGTILNHREVDTPFNMTGVAKSYQILYRTESALGNAEAAVTTLLIPENNANSSRLASYQIAEDAAWIGCAPSYTLTQEGNTPDSSLQALIDAGYFVNTPDYEGPSSSFTAGIQAGHAVLDSIRAALSSGNFSGIDKDATVTMWGYSGGSIATGWAAQLQPDYAQDLNIAGAAVGGFVVNLTAVMLYANAKLTTGFIPAGLVGLASQYPELKNATYSDIKPENMSAIMKVTSQCVEADLLQFALTDIFDFFQSGEAILNVPALKDVLDNNTMGATPPEIPLFVYEGGKDEIVPLKVVDETVAKYCEDGASIQYWVNPNQTHVGALEAGFGYALDWIEDRMNGKAVSSGCASSTVAKAATTPASSSNTTSSNTTTTGSASATKSASASGSGAASSSAKKSGADTIALPLTLLFGAVIASAALVM